MTLTQIIERFWKYHKEATPQPWEGSANTPFYASIDKPAPSLSKHDNDRPHYWRCEDVNYALTAINEAPKIIAALQAQNRVMRDALDNIFDIADWNGGQTALAEVERIENADKNE